MTDQTRMPDRTLSEFTAQLASASPAPGGGGAAALTGALAASLAAMAANVTAANPRYAERTELLQPEDLVFARNALLEALQLDSFDEAAAPAEASLADILQRAYAIPKTDPERAARLADAARTACQAPLDMLAHCEQVALLLAAALETASPLLRSDVGCAAALCRAAAEAAAMNVFVNTGLLSPADRAETEARAERLRTAVVQCCARTVEAVFAALRGEG